MANLDPAAEYFEYEPSQDIRDLISVEDVMEELDYGPNGALMYCMEYLAGNLDWFEEYEDEFLIIDCPGQIELYTHNEAMKTILSAFSGYSLCALYLFESHFIHDPSKYFAGCLTAISVMIQLGMPHINVMTKMDQLSIDEEELEQFLIPDSQRLAKFGGVQNTGLNEAIVQLVEEFNMISFVPVNVKDDESVQTLLMHIDHTTGYGESAEPREPQDLDKE